MQCVLNNEIQLLFSILPLKNNKMLLLQLSCDMQVGFLCSCSSRKLLTPNVFKNALRLNFKKIQISHFSYSLKSENSMLLNTGCLKCIQHFPGSNDEHTTRHLGNDHTTYALSSAIAPEEEM